MGTCLKIYPAAVRSERGQILIECLEWCEDADVAGLQDYRLDCHPKNSQGEKGREGALFFPNGRYEYTLWPTGDYRLLWKLKGKPLSQPVASLELGVIDPAEYYNWSPGQLARFYAGLNALPDSHDPVKLFKDIPLSLAEY